MLKEVKLDVNERLFELIYDKVRLTTSADSDCEVKIRSVKKNLIETYLVKMDWQEGDICGLEFFKKEE